MFGGLVDCSGMMAKLEMQSKAVFRDVGRSFLK